MTLPSPVGDYCPELIRHLLHVLMRWLVHCAPAAPLFRNCVIFVVQPLEVIADKLAKPMCGSRYLLVLTSGTEVSLLDVRQIRGHKSIQ